MASSKHLKSHSRLYASTLPKTLIRSDFLSPGLSEYVPKKGHDFAYLVYVVNRRWRRLAVSVTLFLVLIGYY